jgi:HAD superfamily PSPase-like hydrolase
MVSVCRCVVFDCDGVLVDSVSSWKTLHDGFGTDNSKNLSRFIAGEITDVEFMSSDIAMWKAIQDPIHKDELFRMYSGASLMKGARETIQHLQDSGVYVAIVSAGVDLFVSSIAAMLKVDDWIANGFEFDEDGFLSDDGICRLHASGKGDVIHRLMEMHGFSPDEIVSVGDSEMDLSMMIEGSHFIGFNPSRESSINAFSQAKVPIVYDKDLSMILQHINVPSGEGN